MHSYTNHILKNTIDALNSIDIQIQHNISRTAQPYGPVLYLNDTTPLGPGNKLVPKVRIPRRLHWKFYDCTYERLKPVLKRRLTPYTLRKDATESKKARNKKDMNEGINAYFIKAEKAKYCAPLRLLYSVKSNTGHFQCVNSYLRILDSGIQWISINDRRKLRR